MSVLETAIRPQLASCPIGRAATVIHLVTNCTARKRIDGPTLRVRDLGAGTDAARARRWVRRLAQAPSATTALDTYAGEHWLAAQQAVGRHGDVRLWVVSAGYGLIAADAAIAAYSATFTPGQPDSVASGRSGQRRWWLEVNDWEGPRSDTFAGRQSLAQLAATGPILAALSGPYLAVLEDELRALDPTRAALIATGGSTESLSHLLLDIDGSARTALGGTLTAVNIKVAQYLLDSVPHRSWSRPALDRAISGLREKSSPLPKFNRAKMTDQEVDRWIAQQLKIDPTLTASRALRMLRSQGQACEQHRFGELFHDAVIRRRA